MTRVHELRQQIPHLTRGEGVMESSFDRYELVRGPASTRPRTDDNPLNREEYLRRVIRHVSGPLRDDPWRAHQVTLGIRGEQHLVLSFNSVLIIAGISVLVPVVLGLLPWLPVPGAVLMVVVGIVVGPSVLGWARIDAPVQVLAQLGLGMLLFMAGLEIDVDRLRSPLSRLAGVAFGVSAALGVLCALFFWLAGQAHQPFLLAIILMSTSPGCCCRY